MGQTQTKKNSGDDAKTDEKASLQSSAAALTPEKQALTEEEKQLLELCGKKDAEISQFTALLDQGARLNIHNKDGLHPLWRVSYRGRTKLVDLFLQRGADVDLPTANKLGETALITASAYGYLETVKLLLQRGASINYQRKDGVTALYFASKNNHVAVVELLLKSGAQVNKGSKTPLYTASLNGRLNIVQILLDHGADVNQPTDTKIRSSPLGAACEHNHPQIAQLLINHNADVNYQDSAGDTPIHFAVDSGHLEVVKLLVQSHTNLNVKNNYGDTPLHDAINRGHIEVVKELLLSQAKLDIENNAGKTPLQVAEEKKYSEIVSLLKTGVPAPGEGDRDGGSERSSSETKGDQGSVSVFVDEEEEELSVEGLPGEDETDHLSQPDMPPPLTKAPKEGYKCKAQNSLCLVYLPQEINKKLSIETVTDTSVHPKIASNEILITPIVRITSDNMSLSLEKPVVIELAKTIELSDKEANNEVIPLCGNSESSEWKELGSECNCEELKDCISFQVTHFSLYAVISRKPYPSSTVRVKPVSGDIPVPEHLSTPTELTIPELPGFKVQIPPSSINANRETDITATVLYDCPAVCSKDERSRLASSCIELEPHGTTFSKKVSISIPIPDYAEIKEKHPNAQLQIWHSNNKANIGDSHTELSWTLVEHSMHQDDGGLYTAVVLINDFSFLKEIWDTCVNYFYPSTQSEIKPEVESIKARCQVFMSQEVSIHSFLTFSIAVLYCPYEREPVLDRYKYELAESGLLDLKVSHDTKLSFQIELSRILECTQSIFAGKFDISGRQRKEFQVELSKDVALVDNLPMGKLSLGKREGSEDSDHTIMLIKPAVQQCESALPTSVGPEETVSLPSLTSTAPLDSDYLSDVLERLWCVHHKWHNLGLALRMDPTTLDNIEKLYPHDADSCFKELMKRWLVSGLEASWSILGKALESPLVGAIVQKGEDVDREDSALQFETSIMQAATKLQGDAAQYEENQPGTMVEAAKKIASMWMKMAQLIRKECVLKERRFKEEIVDLAKSINKESQEVVRIAASTAEACTDTTMKHAVGGVVERMRMISHQLRILAAGEASRQRDEVSDLEACRLLTDNATNLTSTLSQVLYRTQSASLRVAKETRKKLGLTQIAETDPITGKHDKVRGDRSRERDHCQDSHEGSRGHIPSSSTKKRGHLSSNDLQKVQNSIWEARVQWYNLGLGLEITPDSLDAIKLDNAHKTEDCFRSMLTQWLRRDSPRPTWSALAESLRSPSVGLSHLAQEILAPE